MMTAPPKRRRSSTPPPRRRRRLCYNSNTVARHDLHTAKSRFRHALLLYLPFSSIILDCILKVSLRRVPARNGPHFQNNKKQLPSLWKTGAVLPSIRPLKTTHDHSRPSFLDFTRAPEVLNCSRIHDRARPLTHTSPTTHTLVLVLHPSRPPTCLETAQPRQATSA